MLYRIGCSCLCSINIPSWIKLLLILSGEHSIMVALAHPLVVFDQKGRTVNSRSIIIATLGAGEWGGQNWGDRKLCPYIDRHSVLMGPI